MSVRDLTDNSDWDNRVEDVTGELQLAIATSCSVDHALRMHRKAQWIRERADELEQMALGKADELCGRMPTLQQQALRIVSRMPETGRES